MIDSYLDTLAKLSAAEEVVSANYGDTEQPSMGRRLAAAGTIAAGVGLGAAAGTFAAGKLIPQIPDALKSKLVPVGLGLTAGALTWLKGERDRQRDAAVQSAMASKVLLRVPDEDYARVRKVVKAIQPKRRGFSVHMTSESGTISPEFRREVLVNQGATPEDIADVVWGQPR